MTQGIDFHRPPDLDLDLTGRLATRLQNCLSFKIVIR